MEDQRGSIPDRDTRRPGEFDELAKCSRGDRDGDLNGPGWRLVLAVEWHARSIGSTKRIPDPAIGGFPRASHSAT